jgi:putative DNA primase/helicase
MDASTPDKPSDDGKVVSLAVVRAGLSTELSEDSVARAFTEHRKHDLRFDHDIGRWFEWDGVRWREDHSDKVLEYARQHSRELSGGQRSSCSSGFARGVEKLAKGDRLHAVYHDIWDANRWQLGTPAGTVDLRTGQLNPPRREDYISKITSVAPKAGAPALWLKFLDEVTQSDEDLIRFLQQWMGYCLTGETREHALLFIYGPGGNGKSVFLNIMKRIIGDYGATASMETLVAAQYDRHPAELAALCSARFVTASETEAGRYFAEARLKQLTGSDPITARLMRQNPFTYIPEFKLMIAGNHAPKLLNADEAMRRRMNIVPFIARPAKPDKELERRLGEELGHILQWAIEGCLDWQQNGLVRPAVVEAATADYFAEQDVLGAWLDECCVVDQGNGRLMEAIALLKADFERFAADREACLFGPFGTAMRKRGFEPKTIRLNGKVQKALIGVRLRTSADNGGAT